LVNKISWWSRVQISCTRMKLIRVARVCLFWNSFRYHTENSMWQYSWDQIRNVLPSRENWHLTDLTILKHSHFTKIGGACRVF
jgi:hypothetical protein